MKKILLPSFGSNLIVQKRIISEDLILGSTKGLVKTFNEDFLGVLESEKTIRLCIADGHWGDEASNMIRDFWMNVDLPFPRSFAAAVGLAEQIEKKIFLKFGNKEMDATSNLTPEAAFISAELSKNILRIVSYGDCRLLLIRNQEVFFELETKETWLGAFSYLGLRQRLAVKSGLSFKKIPVLGGDLIIMFSDGIDQCVYGKPTISNDRLLELESSHETPLELFSALINEVFSNGAEDNASLIILRISKGMNM